MSLGAEISGYEHGKMKLVGNFKSHFSWKNGQKMPFFHVFWVDQANFSGFPLEYLDEWASFGNFINFWIFGTYIKLIAHLVRAREPPKDKKSKIRVTRKSDLETQNWVYSFSSFIEPYQTHIVTVQMLSTFFHLLDRLFVHPLKNTLKILHE